MKKKTRSKNWMTLWTFSKISMTPRTRCWRKSRTKRPPIVKTNFLSILKKSIFSLMSRTKNFLKYRGRKKAAEWFSMASRKTLSGRRERSIANSFSSKRKNSSRALLWVRKQRPNPRSSLRLKKPWNLKKMSKKKSWKNLLLLRRRILKVILFSLRR